MIADYASTSARQDRYTQTGGTTAPVELYASSSHYAYQDDALGSVRRITDGSGSTDDTYAYDAWGGTTQTGSLSQPFQYAAMPIDSTDSLYYAQARFYDPMASGGHRFLSLDPMGGGYAYARDSPTNFVDPTGMLGVGAGFYYHVLVDCSKLANCARNSGSGGNVANMGLGALLACIGALLTMDFTAGMTEPLAAAICGAQGIGVGAFGAFAGAMLACLWDSAVSSAWQWYSDFPQWIQGSQVFFPWGGGGVVLTCTSAVSSSSGGGSGYWGGGGGCGGCHFE